MKKAITHRQLELAMEIINYGIKEGFLDVDIENMTDEEVIELSTDIQDKGDAAYDAWKERDI